MATTRYRYAPLDSKKNEIRLLHADKGRDDQTRLYSLHHISLDGRPEFVALSYCWGRQGPDRSILINGQHLNITRSLETALCNVAADVPLWIDAVCINQDDPEEKTWQVRLMRNIYSTAAKVIIWLGPSTYAADNLLMGVDDLGHSLIAMGFWNLVLQKQNDLVT